MKRVLVILTSFFFILAVKGQSKPGNNKHYVLPQIALLNGDRSASGQVQLTAGIRKSSGWMFGLGTAVDYYKVRTVPVFADLRYAFGKKSNYFSYADLGTSIAWALESQYADYYELGIARKNKFSNGLYTDVGIGYAVHEKQNAGLIISIGYSVKTISSSFKEGMYRDFPPYGIEYRDKRLDYTLNRLVLRIGVKL